MDTWVIIYQTSSQILWASWDLVMWDLVIHWCRKPSNGWNNMLLSHAMELLVATASKSAYTRLRLRPTIAGKMLTKRSHGWEGGFQRKNQEYVRKEWGIQKLLNPAVVVHNSTSSVHLLQYISWLSWDFHQLHNWYRSEEIHRSTWYVFYLPPVCILFVFVPEHVSQLACCLIWHGEDTPAFITNLT